MNLHRLFAAAVITGSILTMNADRLVILHTNDTHSQIDPDRDDLGGIHRRKALVDSVRAANDNVLLIDAGDIVQGTLFFNVYNGAVEEMLMNLLDYDIRILGNHEFDNGMQVLADNLSISNADLLCSNYQTKGTPLAGIFQPYTIREISGKRIAFMPINLNPEGMVPARNCQGLNYVDAIETANNMAWYLKNIMQADMVVALTHIGYRSKKPDDVTLVGASKDIDLVIGGHTHTYLDPENPKSDPWLLKNVDGREILVAQAGRGGRYVGEIDIDLDDLSNIKSRLIRVDSRFDDRLDPAIEEAIRPYRNTIDSLNATPISRTARYLDKDKPAILNFIADFVAYRGRQLADNVDFAIINKGGLRNSLPKGDVSEGQVITLMPFYNLIQVIDISGADLLDAFDVMAAANGNGVSREIEAAYNPDTDKCYYVKLKGREIDPGATYRIATIDYLSGGGDYMFPLTKHTLVAESDKYLYGDLIDYLKSGAVKKIDASDQPRMSPQ